MFRAVKFFWRYISRHPLYVVVYAIFFFLKKCVFDVTLYSELEISHEIKKSKSIIRFGDGEINILLSLKNHYHNFSPELQKMLQEIVSKYTNHSPYILAIPRFVNVSNVELKKNNKFNVWLPLKVIFYLKFNKNASYYDAHSFYYENYFERVVGPLLVDKQVVLITKKETIDLQSLNKNIPWPHFSYVEVPETEALAGFDHIKFNIEHHIKNKSLSNVVLLFALGPVGKYMAYTFAEMGIQSLDIGKVAEVMYTEKSIEYLI